MQRSVMGEGVGAGYHQGVVELCTVLSAGRLTYSVLKTVFIKKLFNWQISKHYCPEAGCCVEKADLELLILLPVLRLQMCAALPAFMWCQN